MNKNEIIGIQYVGKKDVQEDTVCKTGAVWTKNQTHNFSGAIAAALLVHTDSFARAPVSMDGGTFLSSGKRAKHAQQDVAAYVNLSNMGADQLIHFARRELNRVVNPEGKNEDQVRREVHSLMINHNLDLEAERITDGQAGDGRIPFAYMATKEEHEALMSGLVVLMIVPAEVAPSIANDVAQDIQAPADTNSAETPPTLTALLDSLDKDGLLAFAEQETVNVDKRLSEAKLRTLLFEVLSAKHSQAAE